ncbi:MAG: hypothetical protein HRU22_00480 [Gammaproteobacteria bacterium]|nr:hypothetical protein [Gammaproteobacteria bacterium]
MSTDDKKLSQLYQRQAIEQPSNELDQKIIDHAKSQLAKTEKTTYKVPLSIAASMAMVGLLFVNFPQYYQLSPPPLPEDFAPTTESTLESTIDYMPTLQSSSPMQLQAKPQVVSDHMIPSVQGLQIKTIKEKVSLSKSLSSGLTPDQQQQLKIIDKLLDTDRTQAIKQLRELQQQYPALKLADKYQSLLKQ